MSLRPFCVAFSSCLALMGAGLAQAQEPVFADVVSLPVAATDAWVDAGPVKIGGGLSRPAPVLMRTEATLAADGSVSIDCDAHPSAVPHRVHATQSLVKTRER